MLPLEHHLQLTPAVPLDPRALPTSGGVYLVSDADNRPILLATAQNLRRIVPARLTAPPPEQRSKRARLNEIAAKLSWRQTFSRFETTLAHWRIARTVFPKSYRKQLSFGPAWYLRVRPDDRTPRFTPTRSIDETAGQLGPFPARRNAEDWWRLLEDAFDLCRYNDTLDQAPAGLACSYFDMGRCPAPCNGAFPLDAYRASIRAALDFSLGDSTHRLTELRQSMKQSAADLAFERAATIRETIQRLETLPAKPEFRFLADPLAARYLIIQRAAAPNRSNPALKPFFFIAGNITQGAPIPLAQVPHTAPDWISRCRETPPPPAAQPDDWTLRTEASWLLAKFLFQTDRAPGLFIRADALGPPEELAKLIQSRFADSAKPNQPGRTTPRGSKP